VGQRVRDWFAPPVDGGRKSFAGTLGTRIYQAAPRDPETKGVVERANGFLETSFMPGRSFASPNDYNTQLAGWLPRANARLLRRTGQQPGIRIAEDAAAMRALPPVAPAVGITSRVRLGRDYYVRVAGNDYSVDPHVIGRFVDVHAGLDEIAVTCAGTLVATHQRCWATHQNITDPSHVVAAAELRTAYQARTAATRRPQSATGTEVGQRSLSHYDEVFGLPSPQAAARPNLQVVR
jgi:transposase